MTKKLFIVMLLAAIKIIWYQAFTPVVMLCLLVSACGLFDGDPDWSEIEDELEENRTKWDSHGLTDYQYVFQYTCCGPAPRYPNTPIQIVVKSNVVDTVTFLRGRNQPYRIDEWPTNFEYPTIDELFDLMHEAVYGEGWYEDRPDEFWAEYDPEYGYPTDVWIDYALKGDDEEDSFDAHSLEPLEVLSAEEQRSS